MAARATRSVLISMGKDTHLMEYEDSTTVGHLASALSRKTGFGDGAVRLVVSGKALDHERTVLSYGVGAVSRVIAVRVQAEVQTQTDMRWEWDEPPQALPAIETRRIESFPLPTAAQVKGVGRLDLYVWCTAEQEVHVCPQNHLLEESSTREGIYAAGFFCDKCRRTFPAGTARLHCATCRYDVCFGSCASPLPTHVALQRPDSLPDGSLPHQLQRGKVRPVGDCTNPRCHQKLLLFDDMQLQEWSHIVTPPDALRGTCVGCNRCSPMTLDIRCGGTKHRRGDDGSSVCNTSHTTQHVRPLPGLVSNDGTGPASIDSGDPDFIQVEAHPCGHRMSVEGMGSYLKGFTRDMVVINELLPEIFGRYAIRCFDPNCRGIYFLPTLRIAGPAIYNKIRDWDATETILREGGLICSLCHLAYKPPAGESGPLRKCPNCTAVFCQEHGQLACECPHTVRAGPEWQMRNAITNALTEAVVQLCPNCRLPGQKDLACSHITCHVPNCGHLWCYWCGQSRNGGHGASCPQFLHHCHFLATSAGPALAAFHRLRALRLLRQVRARNPAIFDQVFELHFSALFRTIEIAVERQTYSAPTIRLADVLAAPDVLPAGIPHP